MINLRTWSGDKVQGEANEGHNPQEMCPDVPSLRVDSEDRGETFPEAGQRWTVTFLQEVIILKHNNGVLSVGTNN